MFIYPSINMAPVVKGAGQSADVDEIKGFGIGPIFSRVIYFEEEIAWPLAEPKNGDISRYNFGFGESFGNGNGPVPRPCANV